MLHNTLIDINGMDLEARTQFPFSSQNVRKVKCFLDQKKKIYMTIFKVKMLLPNTI